MLRLPWRMQGREQAVDRPGMMKDSFGPASGRLQIMGGHSVWLARFNFRTEFFTLSPHKIHQTMAIDRVFQQPPWAAGLPFPTTFLRFESKHIRTAGRTALSPTFPVTIIYDSPGGRFMAGSRMNTTGAVHSYSA